jgi:hypothetical protein
MQHQIVEIFPNQLIADIEQGAFVENRTLRTKTQSTYLNETTTIRERD